MARTAEEKAAALKGAADGAPIDDEATEDIRRDLPGENRGAELEEVTVDLSEPDAPDEDPEPQTRKDKKAERGQRHREVVGERDDLRDMFEESRRQNQQLMQILQESNKRTEPDKKAEPEDPKRLELRAIRGQLRSLADKAERLHAAKALTPEIEEQIQNEADELREKQGILLGRIGYEEEHKSREKSRGSAPTETQMQIAAEKAALEAEFADVFGHARRGPYGQVTGQGLAWAKFTGLMAAEGLDIARHAMTPRARALRRQAFLQVRNEEGLGESRRPSPGQRAKYTGGGRGQGGGRTDSNTVTLTKDDIRLGTALFGTNPEYKGPKNKQKLMRKIAEWTRDRRKKSA